MAKKAQKSLPKKLKSKQESKNDDIRRFMVKKDDKHDAFETGNQTDPFCEESKSNFTNNFQLKTQITTSREKQMRITDTTLKIYIPIQKINNFGIFNNCKPEDPEKAFQRLRQIERKRNEKQKIKQKQKKSKSLKKLNKPLKKLTNNQQKQTSLFTYMKNNKNQQQSNQKNQNNDENSHYNQNQEISY